MTSDMARKIRDPVATTARWAIVIVVDDGTRADRDELFMAVAEAAGPFTERMGVDVMGLPMDEVSGMAADYGN